MQHDSPYPRGTAFWSKAWQTLQGLLPATIPVAIVFFILPHLGFTLILGELAEKRWHEVADDLSLLAGSTHVAAPDVLVWFEALSNSILTMIIGLLFATALFVCGYFLMCIAAQEYFAGNPISPIKERLGRAISRVPGGVMGLAVVLFLAVFTQFFFPPLILAVVPFIMTPILMIEERLGILRGLQRSFSLAYAPNVAGARIGIFFQLMTIAALFYLGILLTVFLAEFLVTLDHRLGFSNPLWSEPFASSPYTFMYFVSQVFEAILSSLFVLLLLAFTSSTYAWIKAYEKKLPSEGIRV